MEIKQGDTVKVSKDAPKVYLSSMNNLFKYHVCKVEEVDGDSAIIRYTDIGIDRWLAIPCKYLVKVDAEAKEAKYKVGNWVMISGVFNPQLNGMIGWISRIDKDGNKVSFQDGRFAIVEDKYLTLITQPTEQSSAEKPFTDRATKLSEQTKLFLDIDGLIEPPFRTIPKIMFNTEFWVKYEADLAKELALKVANKYNDPEQAADYAVSVAKAVVEGLKGK